jgi:hypothetical protein
LAAVIVLRCRAASTPLSGGGYFLEEYCFAVRFRVAVTYCRRRILDKETKMIKHC